MLQFALYGLLSAAIAFAAVPLVLHAIGSRLPRAHVVQHGVHVAARPARVFAVIADVASHPKWRKRLGRVQILSDAPLRYRERGRDGMLELEVEESRAPERFVIRTAQSSRGIFTGTWTFDLAEEDEGTRVTLTERGEIASPVARLFARWVLGHGANVERTLSELRAHLQSGGR